MLTANYAKMSGAKHQAAAVSFYNCTLQQNNLQEERDRDY
jgi:hypothetical protein